MNRMFNNEEDIRGKLLLPYLEDLGIDINDISLEKSFNIRLGRRKHTIGGRSDILCRINDRNLFIVELKKDGILISQEDVDQGISYARLLDNIAPFTIISNGRETVVYDSITRKKLDGIKISQQSDFWRNGCTLSSDEDLNIRHAALNKFISFSSSNLEVYCKNQIEDRISPITGKHDDVHAKYVPSTYIQRAQLENEFKSFLQSNKPVFCIVGESGVGKTSSICNLALGSISHQFPMFYNAALMSESPINYIAKDLNLFFSSKVHIDKVFERLNSIGVLVDRTVVIFVDSLDESTNSNMVHEISEIAYSVSKFDRIKLVVSCKLNVWNRFIRINDVKTHLYEEALKYKYIISPLKESIGFHLDKFSEEETSRVIPIYRKLYGFKGDVTEAVFNKISNGFFLRIFSEVYANKPIPDNLNDIELIKRYLFSVLNKVSISMEKALRILSAIGKSLVQRDFDRWAFIKDEGVDVIELIEDINLSIDETLPEDLFTVNILAKSKLYESFSVSFYYSIIRDYIICYHSYRLDKLQLSKFTDIIGEFYRNYIGQSAINFYAKNAPQDQLRRIQEFKVSKILQYLNLYEEYLNLNFPTFKKSFNPFTEGKISVAMPRDIINEDGYALLPTLDGSTSKVVYTTFRDFHEREPEVFKLGAKTAHSSHIELLYPDTNRIVERNIYNQLEKIIEEGQLNEDFNDTFLLEKVSTILYHNFKRLNYEFDVHDKYFPRYSDIYPIDLEDLANRLLIYRAKHQYQYKGVSKEKIVEKAIADINTGKVIPPFNTVGDFPPYEELERVVNLLIDKGYSKIAKHYLPVPDIPISDLSYSKGRKIDEYINLQFSDERSLLYVQQFFQTLFSGYKSIIKGCFPTLHIRMNGFDEKPRRYFFYGNKSGDIRGWWYGWKVVPGDKEDSFIFRDSAPLREIHKIDGVGIIRGVMFADIVKCSRTASIPVAKRINSSEVNSTLVLRNWFYKQIKDDFREFKKSLSLENI